MRMSDWYWGTAVGMAFGFGLLFGWAIWSPGGTIAVLDSEERWSPDHQWHTAHAECPRATIAAWVKSADGEFEPLFTIPEGEEDLHVLISDMAINYESEIPTFYFSPEGDDWNPGTRELPKRSVGAMRALFDESGVWKQPRDFLLERKPFCEKADPGKEYDWIFESCPVGCYR